MDLNKWGIQLSDSGLLNQSRVLLPLVSALGFASQRN